MYFSLKLLRSVFGTNEVAECLQAMEFNKSDDKTKESKAEGFYITCFQSPYDKISNFVSQHSKDGDNIESKG